MKAPETRATTARRAAARCLADEDPRVFAEDRIRAEAARLAPAERPLFFEIASGVVRRRLTLDAILAAWTPRGLDRVEPAVRSVLRVALYQILFLDRVPPHAIVHDAVAMTRERAKGIVNAIARGILRGSARVEGAVAPAADVLVAEDRAWRFDRPVFPDPQSDPIGWRAAQAGFSAEAVRRLDAELGQELADALLRHANLRPLPATLRPRGGASGRADLIAALAREGKGAQPLADHPAGVVLVPDLGDVAGLAVFRDGLATVQGPFAARVAPLLAPRAGERVYDLCAAPGGKACQLAEIAGDGAHVVAVVQDEEGANRVRETATRLRLHDVEVVIGDAALGALDATAADAVLLDVPCSNSGVLNRRPEARHRLDDAHLRSLASLQKRLLDAALGALDSARTPARLVYSTCSVLPGENEGLVRAVLADHGGWRVASELRHLPGPGHEDGGYAALLVQADAPTARENGAIAGPSPTSG